MTNYLAARDSLAKPLNLGRHVKALIPSRAVQCDFDS